jgi:DNA repair protein RadD
LKTTPYYYQSEAVNAVFDYFMLDDCGNPLVELPTGAGKSLVQVMIADRMLKEYPDCRVLFLTHQQELIKQNYESLIKELGIVDAGIYSAGLNCRDTENKIIFAGIQSIYKKHLELGCFNIVVVDEAHLIPQKNMGMYRTFILNMREQCPYMKIIGLTATPYRLDTGLLTEGDGKIFDEIIYRAPLGRLIKEGYLCKLVGKSGIIKPDLSGVHIRGGEYVESELATACDNSEVIQKAVEEIINLTADRNHILLFCTGIAHAEHVAEEFCRKGVKCEVIHSELSDNERNRITDGFKSGDIRMVANVNLWTTGFNAKFIDCIVLLRPTKSTGLYYQMVGRGLRLHPDKKNCLILDYAGCILEHGPLDKIEVVDKGNSGDRGVKTAPQKECPGCKQAVHLSAVICPLCGYEFPVSLGHGEHAIDADPISKYKPPVEHNLNPDDIRYYVHEKAGNLSMRVTYSIGLLESVSEWVCIQHEGYAAKKAREWLRKSLPAGYPVPDSVEECMELTDVFKKPCTIYVDYNQKFPRIISRIFSEEEEKEVVKNEEIIYKSFVR